MSKIRIAVSRTEISAGQNKGQERIHDCLRPMFSHFLSPLPQVMRLSTSAGADADREMYEIAQEEHGECLRVLAAVQLELESLLLPRYARP